MNEAIEQTQTLSAETVAQARDTKHPNHHNALGKVLGIALGSLLLGVQAYSVESAQGPSAFIATGGFTNAIAAFLGLFMHPATPAE